MESLSNSKYLGQEKISKLLLKFSIPSILSLLISSLYNIVDQIFIGNSELGYLGNAATTVIFPLTIISMAFAWCFGNGAGAFLSICQGKKDTKNAPICIGNSFVATFAVSILFIAICFVWMDDILFAFGASNLTIGLAKDYFTIILLAMPIHMLTNMMDSVIRADGSPIFSMISLLLGAVINIALDPLFIFVFNWGIEGAALATIIGEIVSFIVAGSYFFRSKTFRLKLHDFIPNFKLFANVLKLGISTFITQISIVIVSLVCNTMLVKYGTLSQYGQDIPIAVIGIAMKVFTIVINIVVGIILGGQPILGYNYGARNYKRVKETYGLILTFTVIVGIIATIIFQLFPEAIIRIFGEQSALYNQFAVKTFHIYLSLVLFTCIVKMTSIFFQAVGQSAKAIIISFARDILCFVPLVILLPQAMGIDGILWAAPIADVIGLVLTVVFVTIFFKSLDKKDKSGKDKRSAEIATNPTTKGIVVAMPSSEDRTFLEENRRQNLEFARRRYCNILWELLECRVILKCMKPKGLQNLSSVFCNDSVFFMQNLEFAQQRYCNILWELLECRGYFKMYEAQRASKSVLCLL